MGCNTFLICESYLSSFNDRQSRLLITRCSTFVAPFRARAVFLGFPSLFVNVYQCCSPLGIVVNFGLCVSDKVEESQRMTIAVYFTSKKTNIGCYSSRSITSASNKLLCHVVYPQARFPPLSRVWSTIEPSVPAALAKASFSCLKSPQQLSFLPRVFSASQQQSYVVVQGRNISDKTQNTKINIGL